LREVAHRVDPILGTQQRRRDREAPFVSTQCSQRLFADIAVFLAGLEEQQELGARGTAQHLLQHLAAALRDVLARIPHASARVRVEPLQQVATASGEQARAVLEGQ
jgi:hypothetical protein